MKKSISVFVALTVIFSFWAVPAYSSYNNNSAQPVTVEEVGDPVVSGRYTYIINADGNTITLTATSLSSTTASINIPSEIDGLSVTGLGDSLFSGFTKLTAVTIPDGIKTMGMYVFRNTKIVSINIPKSVENIDRTFYSCTALKTVTVADDNQYYTAQNNVLYNKDKSTLVYYPSALTDVMFAIPSTVKRIANSAFALAKLRSITLNEGLEEIDDFAFSACTALASVNLPNSLISIGIGTFSGCAISEVKIPSSLKLADGAFRNTKNLTMITVDTENRAFIVTNGVLYTADGTKIVCCPAGSQVTKFAIPTEVTEIGNSAFSYQTNLATVSGTENLTTISDYAFYSCSSLTQIGKTDNIEFVGASAFYACGISKFQLPNVKTIGAYAFRQNTALTNVEIGDTNISLGIATFAGCTNLVSVRLSDNLTQLSNILFNDCSKLSEVNIPKKLTKIGDSVFYGCSSISEVDLPQGCEGIGQSAFNGCSVLERINIPVSLTYIENSSFSGCTKLAYVYYAGNISQWNNIKIDSGNINLTNATIYYADLTTPIPLPSATPYNGPTASPSATPKPTVSPTATPRPTAEPTATPTQKPTVTATPMPTPNYNWAIDDYSNKIVKVEVPSDMADGTAAVVYIAKYGSDGGLEDYETIDFTTQSGRTQYKLTGKNDITATATEKVKVMLWDNTENCTPLCEAFDAAVPADKGAKAFPGAEGPGKYTTGARGTGNIYEPATSVYHVTNLNDSGEGSFRDAVRNNSNSIVVFDVGGTINIKKPLEISGSNLTILGQTAPGDGITITGANVQVGGTNNIVRYLRIRPGTVNGLECDGFGGYIENCIIDHCSASYSVDECLTFYSNRNVTVQNCISSESLKNSIHSKGDHGYGGIWGGTNTSYHHNLMATHDSRTPRLDRQLSGTDVRNNIIYNWGQTNSAYGGESVATDGEYCGIDTYVNWVNNYYKQGPGTASKLMSRIFDTSSPKEYPSYFYFSGNYMTGYPEVTADNTKGVRINAGKGMVFLSDPVDMSENIPFESAEDTYNTLLRHVGASLPKRDETDARVVSDTVNGTGRIIDATQEVGDVMQYPETKRVFEIPSEWKVQNEMDSNAETDIVQSGKWAGYTWIEAYVNDWTESQETPSNPQIVVSSPAISSLGSEINGIKVKTGGTTTVTSGTPIEYKATVIPTSGTTITKTELWINGSVSKTYAGSNQIEDTVSLDPGTYFLTSMAYNNKGEATRSTESIVVVTE